MGVKVSNTVGYKTKNSQSHPASEFHLRKYKHYHLVGESIIGTAGQIQSMTSLVSREKPLSAESRKKVVAA